MSPRDRERGAATIELVLLTPVLIVVLLFIVALGRLTVTRQHVDAAARDAARAAANARTAPSARIDANTAARATLTEGAVTCRTLTVNLQTSDFRAGGTVTVTVSCVVDFADLAGLRLPASRTIAASFTAPIDAYRGVS